MAIRGTKAAKAEFDDRFRELIEGTGLSDADLASLMGISATQVYRIRHSQRHSVRLENGLKLIYGLQALYGKEVDVVGLVFGPTGPPGRLKRAASKVVSLLPQVLADEDGSHSPEGDVLQAIRGLQDQIDALEQRSSSNEQKVDQALAVLRRGRGRGPK